MYSSFAVRTAYCSDMDLPTVQRECPGGNNKQCTTEKKEYSMIDEIDAAATTLFPTVL